MLHVERILAPTDFSEHAAKALAHAREIAVSYGARLELLHVLEEPAFPTFYNLGAAALYGEVPDLMVRAEAAMEDLANELAAPPAGDEGDTLDVSYRVCEGRAGAEILEAAADVDLVVIASHGMTGLDRLLMGSVAETVVRGAPCPVLVIKSFGRLLVDVLPVGGHEGA